MTRRVVFPALAASLFAAAATGCGSGDSNAGGESPAAPVATSLKAGVGPDKGPAQACKPDESEKVPADRCTTDAKNTKLPPCGTWVKVELPGTVCGDGSQYKFFVNYSNTSNDLLVNFEPGGACWDYASCTGEGGTRGAANPHGIPDDHMSVYQYLNLLRRTGDNPAQDYNMVFVSYCTGDIHTGDKDATYPSDDKIRSVAYHHHGHKNTAAVAGWLSKTFTTVPKLFVNGCSAGGAGALLNYPILRAAFGSRAQCGYLLDDSGPIFHGDGPSMQLDAKIRDAWGLDDVLGEFAGTLPVAADDLRADFGRINTAIARAYPHDRLALTAYRMDLNYSLYSYQRFFPGSTEAQIHAYWERDLAELAQTFDAEPNLAYYLPYFRTDNCSHCVSIPPIGNDPLEPTDETKALTQPWLGSEIPADKIDLKQYTTDLLDDTKPMRSYVQDVITSEAFTSAELNQCLQGG